MHHSGSRASSPPPAAGNMKGCNDLAHRGEAALAANDRHGVVLADVLAGADVQLLGADHAADTEALVLAHDPLYGVRVVSPSRLRIS